MFYNYKITRIVCAKTNFPEFFSSETPLLTTIVNLKVDGLFLETLSAMVRCTTTRKTRIVYAKINFLSDDAKKKL